MKDREFNIAFTNKRDNKIYTNKKYTWAAFYKMLEETKRTYETIEEYKKMSKKDKNNIKDVGGFVCGYLKNGKRNIDTIANRSMITLDIDNNPINIWDTIELLFSFKIIMYSTHSHTSNNQRLRLVIPLDRDVTPEEYEAIARHIAWEIDNSMNIFDNTTYQVNRMMFLPSTPKDGEYIFKHQDGELLIADNILDKYMDWKDITTWPRAESEKDIKIRNSLNKAEDPLTKKGIIGAFCRTYTITEGINEFLKDIYVPGADETRYTYAEGSTTGGAIIYDDKFMFSHHSTDPVSNTLSNIFDLVRVHKFRNLDDEVKEGTPVNRLPSFKAMQELAYQDKKVIIQLGKEKMEKAKDDFGIVEITEDTEKWLSKLRYTERGSLRNVPINFVLILENDENLKGKIAFNEFTNKNNVIGQLPWRKRNDFSDWGDSDDSSLRIYLSDKWDIQSKQACNDAFNEVVKKNSYHPVRKYLESLTWDGVERIDTLLIDYFGAADKEYTRMVTRKWLCGAVARIFIPGIKFDYMLVLIGSQGVGKSSFFSMLGKEWFTDSIQEVEGNQAIEKIIGSWIIEFGELQAFSKSETNAIKRFITSTEDKTRLAYNRWTSHLKRQCVFAGTTNECEFLRDETGNRRYWPVNFIGRKGVKSITQGNEFDESIDQIWAEAVYIWRELKEPIFLNKEQERLADEERKNYMVTDVRKGIIEEYLDRLLPENWYDTPIDSRRSFMQNEDFLDSRNTENRMVRKKVCVAEIWVECFGKNKSDLERRNSNSIAAIMKSLDGWDYPNKLVKFKFYGPQKAYIRKE